MFCQRCGTLNSNDNQYCQNCGYPLDSYSKRSNAPPQHVDSKNNNAILIICITLILIVILIAGTFLLLNNKDTAITNNTQANSQDVLTQKPSQEKVLGDDSKDNPAQSYPLEINSGSFYTGSSLSDKTKCNVFVGTQHSGKKVKISVLYSRNGNNLNQGKIVPVTVDSSGYVTVSSADAFKYYPDNAYITLYDENGEVQDTRNVYLDASGGSQSF